MTRLSRVFVDFLHSEKLGGVVLVACTLISITLANSAFKDTYEQLWHFPIFGESLLHLINDGLMTVFFLLIGLELEREIYIGELSSIQNSALPIFAAIGGMAVPALIYYVVTRGTEAQAGIGIPMATDIAFALGALSLLGKRVPASLKVFLTAMAVIDDLGAILVIAVFYTDQIALLELGYALGLFAFMLILNRLKIHRLWPYFILGLAMWYFMKESGVHATVSGVMLAFAIPFGNGKKSSPSYGLQLKLHFPVALVVLPLFALANTAVQFESGWPMNLVQAGSLGIILGLAIGKPLGIASFSYIAWRLKLCQLPEDLKWPDIVATGFLGGIGFTMSIFITLIAFKEIELVNQAKIAILVASVLSMAVGILWLHLRLRTEISDSEELLEDED